MSGRSYYAQTARIKWEAIPDEARKVATLWDRIFVLEEIFLPIGRCLRNKGEG